jgi:hypothetical protein
MIRRLLNSAASHFDVAVGAAIFHRSAASRARSASDSLGPAERLQALDEIAALYDRPEHYLPGAPFFAAPAPITPRATHVRSLRDGQVSDWAWPSPFTLHVDAVADRYFASEPNRTAVARVHLHADRPRPVAILLHGYRAGHFGFEEQSWPVGWFFENGLDLAILALPFHGPRATHAGAPLWPGSDPRITNEGFRQAVLDVRTLAHHLLARGAPQVGVMGMSLGGYTTSLVATIDDRLSFAVPIIPLASIAAVAERLGRLVGTEEDQAAQRAALDRAHRAVSPLARPGLLPGDHMLVAAAEGDRITPPDHAQRLATHFGAPLLTFTGGHIAQIGRGDAFRAVGKLLERLGIWSREG